MQSLCILIDTTGSMGYWINALRDALPEFMHTVALTGVFDCIGIMSYKDYDVSNVVEWSGWLSFADPCIFQFAKGLVASGGGGMPEATRTALYHLIKNLPEASGGLAIMHLADAPEHPDNADNAANSKNPKDRETLDKEGVKEAQILGDRFPLAVLSKTLAKSLEEKKTTLNYASITSCTISPLMRMLHAYSNQHVVQRDINSTSICKNMLQVFNNWCDGSSLFVIPEVASRLCTAITRMQTDEQFATHTYNCLKHCFGDNVMSMCNNDTIGKIWREFCKRRYDQRRGELMTILDKSKAKLTSVDRKKFEDFNRNSYSCVTEIEENLQAWIDEHGIAGLIRYVPDTLLHPQDILKFCLDCLPESQKQIKEILARLVFENKDYQVGTRIPPHCLPANMLPRSRLEYILHLAAPGTVLSGSPLMILAMLSLGTMLDIDAKVVLNDNKGKWLNFSYFDEEGPLKGTPKIPENYNPQFLRLISKHREYLTDDETTKMDWLLTITNVLRLSNIELDIEIVDFECLNGYYPDQGRHCIECKKDCPLSLVNEDSKCGYCLFNRECPYVFNPKSCFQVQCTKCFSIYARDPRAYLPGRALCYWCRQGDQFIGMSPSMHCKNCKLKFITYHGLHNDLCAGCTVDPANTRKLRTRSALRKAHEVFSKSDFQQIYRSVGVESDDIINIGLIRASETLKPCALTVVELTTKMFDPVRNRAELYQKMLEYAKGRKIDMPECALCCKQVRSDQIGRACGRKACTQRICNDCGVNWYGVLKPGSLIFERHLLCPFCARKPDSRTISRWCSHVEWFSVQGVLDPQNYYAWCVRCNHAKIVGARACHVGQPNIADWTCLECTEQLRNPRVAGVLLNLKSCPSCGVMVDRISGCNHITCQCGTHWCYTCGMKFPSAESTLMHLRARHGRIYAGEDPYWSDEGENEGEDLYD